MATFVSWSYPIFLTVSIFLMYVYLGNEITTARAFFVLIVSRLLDYPIRTFP